MFCLVILCMCRAILQWVSSDVGLHKSRNSIWVWGLCEISIITSQVHLFPLSERGATRKIGKVFNFSFILLVLVMIPWESGGNSLTAQTIILSAFTTPWSFLHLGDGKLMQSQLSGKCGTLDTYCNLSGWHCAMNIKSHTLWLGNSTNSSETVSFYNRWKPKSPILEDLTIYLKYRPLT